MATSKKQAASGDADARFALVAAAFGRRRDVVQKRMFNTENALWVDGKIFTMLTPKGAFVVKLPKDRVDALVEAGTGDRFGPGARKIKEWVAIDPGRGCRLGGARERSLCVRQAEGLSRLTAASGC